MDHYINITIMPDTKSDTALPQNGLMGSVYGLVHGALALNDNKYGVGVSFPAIEARDPGNVIRLHGDSNGLNALALADKLGELSRWVSVSDVLPVPDHVNGHAVVTRFRLKMGQAQMRRMKKRGTFTAGDERAYLAKMKARAAQYPHINVQSRSTGQTYPRHIKVSEVLQSPVAGEFDNFGLSQKATVPLF